MNQCKRLLPLPPDLLPDPPDNDLVRDLLLLVKKAKARSLLDYCSRNLNLCYYLNDLAIT